MSSKNPVERQQIARLAVYESWARTTDPSARTAPARAAFLDRFEREVDAEYPDLPEAARRRMAESKRKAYFVRLALKATQARRRKKETEKPLPLPASSQVEDVRSPMRAEIARRDHLAEFLIRKDNPQDDQGA